jgi:hypothetical protein
MKIPFDEEVDEQVQESYCEERIVSPFALEERVMEPDLEESVASLIASEERVKNPSNPADNSSDAVRAVLMYHLRARRLQVHAALQAAVLERNVPQILKLCHEAEATGVAQTEIAEALAVAAKIRSRPFETISLSYETSPETPPSRALTAALVSVHLEKEAKPRPALKLKQLHDEDAPESLPSISTVASESFLDFGRDSAPAL